MLITIVQRYSSHQLCHRYDSCLATSIPPTCVFSSTIKRIHSDESFCMILDFGVGRKRIEHSSFIVTSELVNFDLCLFFCQYLAPFPTFLVTYWKWHKLHQMLPYSSAVVGRTTFPCMVENHSTLTKRYYFVSLLFIRGDRFILIRQLHLGQVL